MSFFQHDQPLWLPEGSGRLIMAWSLVFGLIYASLSMEEIPAELSTLAVAVTAYYFGSKAKNGGG